MRVNQQGNNPVQGSEVSGAKQSGRAKHSEKGGNVQESGKTAHRGASAEISSKGREFAQAKSVAAGAPDIREDKVADLKRRISEGNYKVDTHAVADRMVDDHLKMSAIR